MRNLILSLIAFSSITAPALAQQPLGRAEKLVQAACAAPAKKFLLKDLDAPTHTSSLPDDPVTGKHECRFRIVIVSDKGVRYTIDNDWWIEGLQIWERPNGTSSTKVGLAYADNNNDGVVDWGTDGKSRFFGGTDPKYHDPKHRDLYQGLENGALDALEAALAK